MLKAKRQQNVGMSLNPWLYPHNAQSKTPAKRGNVIHSMSTTYNVQSKTPAKRGNVTKSMALS